MASQEKLNAKLAEIDLEIPRLVTQLRNELADRFGADMDAATYVDIGKQSFIREELRDVLNFIRQEGPWSDEQCESS
jgi:hypothetical protein